MTLPRLPPWGVLPAEEVPLLPLSGELDGRGLVSSAHFWLWQGNGGALALDGTGECPDLDPDPYIEASSCRELFGTVTLYVELPSVGFREATSDWAADT